MMKVYLNLMKKYKNMIIQINQKVKIIQKMKYKKILNLINLIMNQIQKPFINKNYQKKKKKK